MGARLSISSPTIITILRGITAYFPVDVKSGEAYSFPKSSMSGRHTVTLIYYAGVIGQKIEYS